MAGSEPTSELDQELIASLEKFDGMLASEQQTAGQARAEAEAAAAAGSSGGSGAFGDEGSDFGDPVGGGQTGEEQTAGSRAQPASGEGTSEEESGAEGAAPAGSAGGGGGGGRVPDDVGDGSDDDIVARQLREAATNEDDPELREKLWDEYREYKAAVKRKSG